LIAGGFWYTASQSKKNIELTQDNAEVVEEHEQNNQEAIKENGKDNEKTEGLKIKNIDTSNWQTY